MAEKAASIPPTPAASPTPPKAAPRLFAGTASATTDCRAGSARARPKPLKAASSTICRRLVAAARSSVASAQSRHPALTTRVRSSESPRAPASGLDAAWASALHSATAPSWAGVARRLWPTARNTAGKTPSSIFSVTAAAPISTMVVRRSRRVLMFFVLFFLCCVGATNNNSNNDGGAGGFFFFFLLKKRGKKCLFPSTTTTLTDEWNELLSFSLSLF